MLLADVCKLNVATCVTAKEKLTERVRSPLVPVKVTVVVLTLAAVEAAKRGPPCLRENAARRLRSAVIRSARH